MRSLADALPPEIAGQIHPAWRRNEADYWAARDRLLELVGNATPQGNARGKRRLREIGLYGRALRHCGVTKASSSQAS